MIRATAAAALLVACVASACSDDPDATPSPDIRGGEGGVAPAEAGAPDAAITARPELCTGRTSGGQVIAETELPGDAPAPLGGTIVQGTYDLIELDAYRGSEPSDAGLDDSGREPPTTLPTGQTVQATIEVGEFTMSIRRQRGTGAPEDRGLLYRVDGTSLLETQVCPTTREPVGTPFSAITGSLVLFPDATHRELYLRRQ